MRPYQSGAFQYYRAGTEFIQKADPSCWPIDTQANEASPLDAWATTTAILPETDFPAR
jgi:hypothetical protein